MGKLTINTFLGDMLGNISLKEGELMACEWFTLAELESSKIEICGPVVIKQARDALLSN